ncbi:hypothetical protein RRG08_060047, partial [Elysia crispata]
ILTAALIQLERVRGVITSGILWLFWLLSLLAGIVPLYTKLYLKEYENDRFSTVIFFIYFAFSFHYSFCCRALLRVSRTSQLCHSGTRIRFSRF